jgi:peptidoglycan hydrolase-like protein with peptidoglycan-binding domain
MSTKTASKPEISKKWWTSEKPDDIKGADLEKTLAAAEKAIAEEKKKSEARSIDACLAALADVESSVDKTIKKECDKKKHKEFISVLEKFFPIIKSETSRLDQIKKQAAKAAAAEANGEDEEEEDEGKLFEPEYLHKMLKLLKSTGKELNFGFGLNSQDPAGSKLLLSRKGKPEKLFKALKQTGDFSNRLICFGTAMPDAQDGKILVFKLAENAGEPPQIQKLGRQFLRSDKGLKFRKLKLVLPGGQTLEDTEPDPEEDGAAPQVAGAHAAAAGAQTDGAAARNGAFISAAVGKGGQNLPNDVKAVQEALNKYNDAKLATDGEYNAQVQKAIEAFQRRVGQFNPDGKFQPGRGAARVLSGDAKMPPVPEEPKPIEPPVLGKATLDKGAFVWHSTRDILNKNIDELKKGVRAAYGTEHPEIFKAIDQSMGKLNKVVDKLDTRLADALDAAYKAPSDQARVPELKKAEGIMKEYLQYVDAEPLIANMDTNPFGVKTSLQKIISDALVHLSELLPEPPVKQRS